MPYSRALQQFQRTPWLMSSKSHDFAERSQEQKPRSQGFSAAQAVQQLDRLANVKLEPEESASHYLLMSLSCWNVADRCFSTDIIPS